VISLPNRSNSNNRAQKFYPSGKKTNNENIIHCIDQISPELAAQVVKKYVLPMFESDGKKQMKKSSNRLQSIAQGGKSFGINNGGIGAGTGVFNELKLSEILQQELDKVRE